MGKYTRQIVVFALICLTCVIVYFPSFFAPLLFDDMSVIARDPFILAKWRGESFSFFEDFWYRPRPIRLLTHRLDALFYGNNQFFPHFEGAILHIIVGALFYSLLRALSISSSVRLFAVAFFLLHPICAESVCVLSHRKELLSAIFLLSALNFSLAKKKWVRLGVIPCLFIAVFSKEISAITFPMLWVLVFSTHSRQIYDSKIFDKHVICKFCIWVILSGALLVLAWYQIQWGMSTLNSSPEMDPDRAGHFGHGSAWSLAVSAAIRALPAYLISFVVPWGHTVDPPFELNISLFSLSTIGAFLICIAYIIVLLYVFKKDRRLFAPLAWILISLAPYLFPPFLQAGWVAAVADRYAYFPALGFAWFLAELVIRASSFKIYKLRWIFILSFILLACYGYCTYFIASSCRTIPSFWTRVCNLNPRSFQARYNLAYSLWKEEKDIVRARKEFEHMRFLNPGFVFGNVGYSNFLLSQGEYDLALAILDEGLLLNPHSIGLHRARIAALLSLGRYTSALHASRKAEAAGVSAASIQYLHAEACRFNLLWSEAFERYKRASELNKSYQKVFSLNTILISDPTPPIGSKGIMVVGDSVPHGTDSKGADGVRRPLARRISELKDNEPFSDASIPGSQAGGLSEKLPNFLAKEKFRPKWMIIMTGHNDAFRKVPADVILFQISKSIYQARKMGMRVLVIGPIMVMDAPARSRGHQELILAELDLKLSDFCQSNNVAFVSARTTLFEINKSPESWLVPSSGNHLVDSGLEQLAKKCVEKISDVENCFNGSKIIQ